MNFPLRWIGGGFVIGLLIFVVIMVNRHADYTEELGNVSISGHDRATSKLLCQSLSEGIWYRKLADGASGKSATAPHEEESTWADSPGKCGKGSPPDGVTDPIPQAETYDLSAETGKQGGRWVQFN